MARPQPRSQQQSSQPQTSKTDAALIAAIVTLLAVGAAPRPTAIRIAALIGVPVAAVAPIVMLAIKGAAYVAGTGKEGVALLKAQEAEPYYRAAYILSASRRVQTALRAGRSEEEALAVERRWFDQHLAAAENRRNTAVQVDAAAAKSGLKLGWYATLDRRTTPECRAANGKNFDITQPPPIGYPGAVHPFCRCKAGPPHATKQTVYRIKPERKSA